MSKSKKRYRLGSKAYTPEHRYNRPYDVDWEAFRQDFDGVMTAKEVAEYLEISVIAAYTASYRGDIRLRYIKQHRGGRFA